VIVAGQFDFQQIVHLVDIHRAVDQPFIRTDRQVFGLLVNVVFIANIADDLFDQVFDRHQPCCTAVLIHDDGDMHFLVLHLAEQRVGQFGFRHEVRRAQRMTNRRFHRRTLLPQRQQILGVQQAANIIERVIVHGQARMAAVEERFERRRQRGITAHRHNIRPGDHHLASERFAKVENGVDHLLFLVFDAAALLGFFHQRLDLLLGDRFAQFVTVGQRCDHLIQPHQQCRQRAEQCQQQPQRTR